MADLLRKPWLGDQLYASLSEADSAEVPFAAKGYLQIQCFHNYRFPDDSEHANPHELISSDVSDKFCRIRCTYTRECENRILKEKGTRLTKLRGVILGAARGLIKIISLPDRRGLSIMLELNSVRIIGEDGGAVFGEPQWFDRLSRVRTLLNKHHILYLADHPADKNDDIRSQADRGSDTESDADLGKTPTPPDLTSLDFATQKIRESVPRPIARAGQRAIEPAASLVADSEVRTAIPTRRQLHTGWGDFKDLTYFDCQIPPAQQKLLDSEDCWRPRGEYAIERIKWESRRKVEPERHGKEQSKLPVTAVHKQAIADVQSTEQVTANADVEEDTWSVSPEPPEKKYVFTAERIQAMRRQSVNHSPPPDSSSACSSSSPPPALDSHRSIAKPARPSTVPELARLQAQVSPTIASQSGICIARTSSSSSSTTSAQAVSSKGTVVKSPRLQEKPNQSNDLHIVRNESQKEDDLPETHVVSPDLQAGRSDLAITPGPVIAASQRSSNSMAQLRPHNDLSTNDTIVTDSANHEVTHSQRHQSSSSVSEIAVGTKIHDGLVASEPSLSVQSGHHEASTNRESNQDARSALVVSSQIADLSTDLVVKPLQALSKHATKPALANGTSVDHEHPVVQTQISLTSTAKDTHFNDDRPQTRASIHGEVTSPRRICGDAEHFVALGAALDIYNDHLEYHATDVSDTTAVPTNNIPDQTGTILRRSQPGSSQSPIPIPSPRHKAEESLPMHNKSTRTATLPHGLHTITNHSNVDTTVSNDDIAVVTEPAPVAEPGNKRLRTFPWQSSTSHSPSQERGSGSMRKLETRSNGTLHPYDVAARKISQQPGYAIASRALKAPVKQEPIKRECETRPNNHSSSVHSPHDNDKSSSPNSFLTGSSRSPRDSSTKLIIDLTNDVVSDPPSSFSEDIRFLATLRRRLSSISTSTSTRELLLGTKSPAPHKVRKVSKVKRFELGHLQEEMTQSTVQQLLATHRDTYVHSKRQAPPAKEAHTPAVDSHAPEPELLVQETEPYAPEIELPTSSSSSVQARPLRKRRASSAFDICDIPWPDSRNRRISQPLATGSDRNSDMCSERQAPPKKDSHTPAAEAHMPAMESRAPEMESNVPEMNSQVSISSSRSAQARSSRKRNVSCSFDAWDDSLPTLFNRPVAQPLATQPVRNSDVHSKRQVSPTKEPHTPAAESHTPAMKLHAVERRPRAPEMELQVSTSSSGSAQARSSQKRKASSSFDICDIPWPDARNRQISQPLLVEPESEEALSCLDSETPLRRLLKTSQRLQEPESPWNVLNWSEIYDNAKH